jgi:putative colanic acid biosynthesis UDP-glucose lipid carrier transferase
MLHRHRQARTRSVVVVGAGALAARLSQALQARPDLGSHFLGYFDDRTAERNAGPDAGHDPTAGGHAGRLGSLSEAAAYIRRHGVSEVHITLPLGAQTRMRALVEQLQNTTATIYIVPDVSGVSVIQGRLQDIDGIPMVGICDTPFTGTDQLVKRVSDLVLASLILALILPVLLAVAAGVKLSSPGPVLFKQRRNGLNGQEILVYKFRSMRVMENGAVVRQATRGDPRLTRFGAFIRRTSLDELPQFFNVLQGRMSIVGPRPHAVAHNEHYSDVVRAYMARHKVKPGITGWAQIHGHRGETDTLEKMQARVEYDLEYLRHWSLALDLKIILRTVRVVFKDDAAY